MVVKISSIGMSVPSDPGHYNSTYSTNGQKDILFISYRRIDRSISWYLMVNTLNWSLGFFGHWFLHYSQLFIRSIITLDLYISIYLIVCMSKICIILSYNCQILLFLQSIITLDVSIYLSLLIILSVCPSLN